MKATFLIIIALLLLIGGISFFNPGEASTTNVTYIAPNAPIPTYTWRRWDMSVGVSYGYVLWSIKFTWMGDGDPSYLLIEMWCYWYDPTDTLICSQSDSYNAHNGMQLEWKSPEDILPLTWCDEQIYFKINATGTGRGTDQLIATLVNPDTRIDWCRLEDSSTGQDMPMTITNDTGIQQS